MKKSFKLILTFVFAFSSLNMGETRFPDNQMVLLPVKNDPTISFKIWFKVGAQNDPKGKEGLAYLTAEMIADAATQKNSYSQIIEKLFPLAAAYNASVNAEMTVISGRTHQDNLTDYYQLLKEAILLPAFQDEDLKRIRSQVLNQLENTLRYSSDEDLGKAVLYNSVYDGTPYGHIDLGLVESVKSITLDDIRNFYKTFYTRDNMVIGLGGGYDAKFVETIQTDLSSLPAGNPPAAAKPTAKPIDGLEVTIVDKDANATAISMGYPISVLRGTKDWYALAIANSWFGEHRNSSSHLYQVIRSERGLNYGDYSYIEHYPNGGRRQLPPTNVCRRQQLHEVWIRPVPNDTRHFTLRAAIRELQKVVDQGLTQEQFNLTRKFLKNYVLNYAPTTIERLGYALDDRFYGLTDSHLEKFRKMMDELTLADVNNAVKKYWQYKNMKIAIVTKDAEGFKQALVANTPSPIQYATPKPQSVLDEDKNIVNYPLAIKAEKVNVVKVQDLFSK